MGEFPKRDRSVPAVRVREDRQIGRLKYRKIQYESEAGDWVPAWLILPDKPGRNPGMIALHQTTQFGKDEPAGLAGKPTLHYGKELAERGYVVIIPDYPSLGENKSDPYAMGYVSTSMKAIWNHTRALDLLVSMPEVDPKRIGAIGHSLGGHNSLFLAVFDPRVKVVVSSCGFTKMSHYKGGDLKGWSGWRYMPRIGTEFGNSPSKIPFDFPEILEALHKRSIYINAPLHDDNFDNQGVRECLRRAGKKTVARYPDTGHDFPNDVRNEAYAFIQNALNK